MSYSDDTAAFLFSGLDNYKTYKTLSPDEKQENLDTHRFDDECLDCGRKPWMLSAANNPCRGATRLPVTGEGGHADDLS